MRISDLRLESPDPSAAADFWHNTLGLRHRSDRNEQIVSVGATRLHLRAGSTARDGVAHLALNIPPNLFQSAKSWLSERVELLSQGDRDEFECPPDWDARSLYFDGPDGSILELIARRRLPNAAEDVFDARHLLCVSEVGICVENVRRGETTLLENEVLPFGDGGDTFRPMGDDEELLILVKPGRSWFPTDRPAVQAPSSVTGVVGSREVTFEFDGV